MALSYGVHVGVRPDASVYLWASVHVFMCGRTGGRGRACLCDRRHFHVLSGRKCLHIHTYCKCSCRGVVRGREGEG